MSDDLPLQFRSTPIGSLQFTTPKEQERLLLSILRLPPALSSLIYSAQVGAYIRGLMRAFNVSLELAPKVAFLVLRVAVGEKRWDEMTGVLQAELNVSVEVAQKMAEDIEKELFEPIKKDLQLRQAKPELEKKSPPLPPNTLDLKNQSRPKPRFGE